MHAFTLTLCFLSQFNPLVPHEIAFHPFPHPIIPAAFTKPGHPRWIDTCTPTITIFFTCQHNVLSNTLPSRFLPDEQTSSNRFATMVKHQLWCMHDSSFTKAVRPQLVENRPVSARHR